MLEATDSKLNDERTKEQWEEKYPFLNYEEIKNDIKEIMVVVQVAEAARPSDETFQKLRENIEEISKIVIETRQKLWEDYVKIDFENHKISIENFDYKNLFELVNELTIPGEDTNPTKQEILKLLGTEADNIVNQEEFYNELIVSLTEAKKKEGKTFKEEIKSREIKLTGRVPYADERFRQVLHAVVNQEENSAKKLGEFLNALFPIMRTTQEGRTDMVFSQTVSRKRKREKLDDEQRDSDNKEHVSEPADKRIKIDPVAASRGDHDNEEITDQVKQAIVKNTPGCTQIKRSVCEIKSKVIENSIQLENDKLRFQTIDENGIKAIHEVEIDVSKLSTLQYTKEYMAKREEYNDQTSSSNTETISKGLAGYGAVVNILGAAQYFSRGEYGQGAFSLAQAAHAIGGLSGVNEVVSKVTKEAFGRVLTYTVEKIGLEKSLERLSEAGAKALGESASKAFSRFTATLPYVGLALDLYFVAEDIKDFFDNNGVPLELKVAHLVLDVSITTLTLIESAIPEFAPFIEPFSIALTIVRITLDDFYYDISYELSLVKGRSFGDKVVAFIRGFEEGIADVFTLGLVSQLRRLDQQKAYDDQLLRNLSNPASYFDVTFKAMDKDGNEVGTVDLTAGILSQYGGFITVKLNDDNSFTITLPEVPTEEGDETTTITKTLTFDKPVNDIVLGVGEVQTPRYIRETAKLWFFIPVQKYDLIDGFDKHQSSRYGVYHGNEEDNDFFAVQGKRRRKRQVTIPQLQSNECESGANDKTTIFLQSYHYDLYGGGGNDRFFLGQQSSRVSGDEGNDLYYLQPDGGKAVINNFALDEEQDTIFLNISYKSVQCYRQEWDLIASYCGSHTIQVKNWFVHGNSEYHKHVYIVTNDGIGIEVTETNVDGNSEEAKCYPVSIDKSRSKGNETISLTSDFLHVKQVTGSAYDDRIIGNDNPNTIRGGLGNDYIEGGNEPDVFLMEMGDGTDEINNYADDQKEDTLVFGVNYEHIKVTKNGFDLIIYDSLNNDTAITTVKLISWFRGQQYQHMALISKDYVRFVIGENSDHSPKLVSLTIDLGGYATGVELDLLGEAVNKNFEANNELRQDVKVILDSPQNDVLKANILGNFLSCSGGNDYLQGRGGKDVYVVQQGCETVTINNYDQHRDWDLLLFKCLFKNILATKNHQNLILQCQGGAVVTMKDWFRSQDFQHCQVKTADKITAFLPESEKELIESSGQLYPVEIESDEDCNGESKAIDLTLPINRKVERFVAKTDACSFDIIGNSLNNYIDPGPDNPYGLQNMRGGNGSDTYIIGHDYGAFNRIYNFAEDNALDYLMFNVIFHDITVSKDGHNAIITSVSRNDSVGVTIIDYFRGDDYQHMLIYSTDNFVFILTSKEPYIALKMIDYSVSPFSQIISVKDSTTMIVTGSLNAENIISSGESTNKVTGGKKKDVIHGGPMGEDLIGLEGDDVIMGGGGSDYIFGGEGDDILSGGIGDDVIYAGYGADTIDGGDGSDYVVFSGLNYTGVTVNLQFGLGSKSDAEGDTYVSIENVLATEYDDIIFGNDQDNFINTYGGSDYIVSDGGRDVLEGGAGNDFYDLTNAYGRKIIMNFATDKQQDLVILNKTNSSSLCYFYLDDDLDININFDANIGSTVQRIQSGTDFLHIKLGYVLRNATYQHISFQFSNGLIDYPYGFELEGKQLIEFYSQITSGYIVTVYSVSHSSLELTFNFTTISTNNLPDSYIVEFVHITNNSTDYHEMVWPTQGGTEKVKLNNVMSGIEHIFIVTLTSCDLNVAISPTVSIVSPPSPPTDITVSDVTFDGFTLSWVGPSENTDSLVNTYNYTVSFKEAGKDRVIETTTVSELSYTTYDLVPETDYHITVASVIGTIEGPASSPVVVRTGKNTCKNLQNLPFALKINGFTKVNGVLVAKFYCLEGFVLKGAIQVACDDYKQAIPKCERVMCKILAVSNSIITSRLSTKGMQASDNCSSKAFEDCVYTWKCKYGYEINDKSMEFSSTCTRSGWSPELKVCIPTPSCNDLEAPINGVVNMRSVLVNEYAHYTCSRGYSLNGPRKSICTRHCDNDCCSRTCLSPNNVPPTCSPMECPKLLPQPNGSYSPNRGSYYTEETVTLTCNDGYYLRNVNKNPHQTVLKCLGENWCAKQTHCMRSFKVTNLKEYLLFVRGTLKYSFSAWSNRRVDSSLHGMVCADIGGSSTFQSINGRQITCQRKSSLQKGPNRYTGFLEVSTKTGKKLVCIKDKSLAGTVCRKLGYSKYTTSVARIGAHSTQLSAIQQRCNWLLQDNKQICTSAVKCRSTCPDLNLQQGSDCTYTLEGQICSFSCRAGYLLVGDSKRQCTGSGKWTGNHPFCDGEAWKADVERESRKNHKKSHIDLAKYIQHYLNNKYSNVLWVVVVYNDVSGWDAHTVKGRFYHLFRHYGHNIVVSRITEPYTTKSPVDIRQKFNRALTLKWKNRKQIDARPTVEATWPKLYNEGLNPIMLHIFRGKIKGAAVTNANQRVHFQRLKDGGLAVLLAVAK